jgi:hypothetical protein
MPRTRYSGSAKKNARKAFDKFAPLAGAELLTAVRKLATFAKGVGVALSRDHLYGREAVCGADGLFPLLEQAALDAMRLKHEAFEEKAEKLRPTDVNWGGALREKEMMEALLEKLGALESPREVLAVGHCHFVLTLIHLAPYSLTYSVPLF